MKFLYVSICLLLAFSFFQLGAQPWEQNDEIFNPSGVPSLPFSQPRFADLDGDGDLDMLIGNINDIPFYLVNMGTPSAPVFTQGDNIFSGISALDAEMGVCCDIDGDVDLDFICGGFTGLHLFINTGSIYDPVFEQEDSCFSGLNVGQNPIPDLADVDNDNDLDLIVGMSESGVVKLYTNNGTVAAPIFSETAMQTIGDAGLYAYPNFCDLDDDNDQDILVGRDIHGFVYFENQGDPYNGNWQINSTPFAGLGNETYWNSPDLVDLNGDITYDLIFGSAAGPLHYYENVGTVIIPSWQLNTDLFGGVLDVGGASNPFFYDFDGDGDLDLVTGSNLGNIKYFRNTGTITSPAWEEDSSYFTSIDHSIYSAVTLGDVNNDNLPDAIVGDLSGHLYYHRNTGSGFFFESAVLAFVALGGWSAPRLVDMDDDTDLDIVAGNEAGNLFYFQNLGSPSLPDWTEIPGFFGNIDVGSHCVPTVADLDLDEDLDILTGNISGDVQFFVKVGGIWMENPLPVAGLSGGQNTTPALADLDGDGDADLTLGNYDGIFNYFENLHQGTENCDYEIQDPECNLLNYPNPFNPETRITFFIKEPGHVILSIYNTKGQKIRILLQNECQSGVHNLTWDGNDDNGNPAPAGIYFYVLKINGRSLAVKKCLLLK